MSNTNNESSEILPRCKECRLGPSITVREPTFQVAFGSYERCMVCGWIAYEDWTAMRAGSVRSWHPPDSIKE
jgi:hypothetical protein